MNRFLILILGILLCGNLFAQQDNNNAEAPVAYSANVVEHHPNASRKKVGVVLSGGGAKGMAHIGVLKVLEKAGIPVDIVTGTSMGSIISGLYSIGYNANALDSLVRVQDWSYVITDAEDLRYQSLSDRKKRYTYVYSTGKIIGKRDVNAGGIIKGKNLSELFQRLCTGYTDSIDFTKDLLIPFACVATNIMDNSEVVFHSGKLPQAMRASMAIPAAFSPVRIGDMVLVDGGLRNNYPADIARQMGADVIIGVTLSGKPKTAEDIEGTMSVISQIIDVNCVNKYEENIAITDLHMNVDPRGLTTTSFSAVAIDSLIRYGEEEAMRHWDEIIALKKVIGIDESFRPTILHPLRPKVLTENQKVTGYTFENMTPQAERFLKQKFNLNKRDSIDAELEQLLTTSMRVDLFYQTAECRLQPEGDGVRVVLTAGNRKSMQLYTGVRYDTEEHVALQFGLNIPFRTSTPINTDLTLRLGKRMMARVDFTVHPSSFTRPTVSCAFMRNDQDIYLNGDQDYSIKYNQVQTEIMPINFVFRHFHLQMGARWDYMHYRNQLVAISSVPVKFENEHFISYRARIDYNSEDNWYFPSRGARFKAEYSYLTDNFSQLDGKPGLSDVNANWCMSFPLSKRFTLQPMIYGRLLFGDNVPVVLGNTVGGDWFGHYVEQQMPFAGIGNMEYVANQFLAAQLRAQQRIAENNYVVLRFSCAQQSGKLKDILDKRTMIGGQIAYYYNSFFGPLGATLGYSNHTKEVYLFVNLGYVF